MLLLLLVVVVVVVVVENVGRTHSAFQRGDQRRDPMKYLSVIALEIGSCLSYHDWRCVGGVVAGGLEIDVVQSRS
jgi:hypothetical protein